MNNITEKPKVVVVVGATASGKTGLGIALAKRFDGEVVSADSMQIYKGMPIATAAPTREEREEVVHHITEFLEPNERFSVADYVSLAKKTIDDILKRGKLPIIVGGTGLYISSLIDGIEFGEQKPDEAVRKQLEEEFENLGAGAMLHKLSKIDKETADRLSVSDKRRIIRALEIYRTSGITITEQNKLSKINGKPYDEIIIGINYLDREKLYERINKRVDLMLQNGILEEAKSFSRKGVTAAQAIGHKEFNEYFSGNVTLDEAVERLKRQTRRYAKRQLTWFRRDTRINWVYPDCEDALKKAAEIIERKL